jgi:hypothetical protein
MQDAEKVPVYGRAPVEGDLQIAREMTCEFLYMQRDRPFYLFHF